MTAAFLAFPSLTFDRVFQEWQWPVVYILHGQNAVNLDDRISELKRELDPSGLGSTTLDASFSTIDEIAAACHSAPFFGGGRLVILRNVNTASARGGKRGSDSSASWKDLLAVLETTPPTTTVIVRADENVASSSIIIKAAASHKWTVEAHPVPRGDKLVRWVMERGNNAGISVVKPAAIQLLTHLYPTSWQQESRFDSTVIDTRLIATEVEKLACAAVDGVVDEDVVRELVADRSGYTAFKLNDLIYTGQPGPALQELEKVLSSGDEPERILAQFASEAAGLEAARHVPEFDPASVARVSGISEGRLRMLGQKPASRDYTTLAEGIERLRRAEWLVKTGRSQRSESVIVSTAAGLAETFRRSRT
ncbi:MAG: hypothetical protein H0V47_07605 [Chloroflexia bacterium]|nr:hypothetical protein [Chloroflexia bacterium]